MRKLLAGLLAFFTLSTSFADTTTTNLNLVLPTVGSPTWGAKLNNNFQIIDGQLINVANSQVVGGTKTFTSPLHLSDGTVGQPSVAFTADATTGLYRISSSVLGVTLGGSLGLAIGDASLIKFYLSATPATANGANLGQISLPWATLYTSGIAGTTTNGNATAGNVGEYIESVVGVVNLPASTQSGELTSIALTAGDWDVSLTVKFQQNAAVYTNSHLTLLLGTASGNNQTGAVDGSSKLDFYGQTATTIENVSGSIPCIRVSLAAPATYYLKVYAGTYSSGTPQTYGARISARRIR